MTVVYSNWLWWYERRRGGKKRNTCQIAFGVFLLWISHLAKQRRGRWAPLMLLLSQHWGNISRLIALDYGCAPWILITAERKLLQLGRLPIIAYGQWSSEVVRSHRIRFLLAPLDHEGNSSPQAPWHVVFATYFREYSALYQILVALCSSCVQRSNRFLTSNMAPQNFFFLAGCLQHHHEVCIWGFWIWTAEKRFTWKIPFQEYL